MTPEQRIEIMKKNLGNSFVDEGKNVLKDGKILKGEDAELNFNTELNELTFEIEELYPLTYKEFKKEFPKTIELVKKVNGNGVVDAVNKGYVIQGWTIESNVNQIIENIKKNVKDPEEANKEIRLRQDVLAETIRMKEDYSIEWNQDLFWKCWKIKEGEARREYLEDFKGKKLAEKRINTLKNIGGIEFLKILQDEIYPQP